jgi:hypothetical protein
MARELLLEIIEAFPQADPASDFYHEEINGCEAVDFLSQFIPRIRNYLDTPPPTVAVVLEGGLVQGLTTDRPHDVPPITFVIIDNDTESSTLEDTVEVPQRNGDLAAAFARVEKPGQATIDLDAVLAQLKESLPEASPEGSQTLPSGITPPSKGGQI